MKASFGTPEADAPVRRWGVMLAHRVTSLHVRVPPNRLCTPITPLDGRRSRCSQPRCGVRTLASRYSGYVGNDWRNSTSMSCSLLLSMVLCAPPRALLWQSDRFRTVVRCGLWIFDSIRVFVISVDSQNTPLYAFVMAKNAYDGKWNVFPGISFLYFCFLLNDCIKMRFLKINYSLHLLLWKPTYCHLLTYIVWH